MAERSQRDFNMSALTVRGRRVNNVYYYQYTILMDFRLFFVQTVARGFNNSGLVHGTTSRKDTRGVSWCRW